VTISVSPPWISMVKLGTAAPEPTISSYLRLL